MKRLALLSIMAVAMWAGACQAAEPSLCKSMCDADQRECRMHVRDVAGENGTPLLAMPEKNPLARTAQVQVPTASARAIDNAGTQSRRMGQAGACDATYLRCTRACAAPAASSVAKPASGHRDGS
jgi:hypothetical protein